MRFMCATLPNAGSHMPAGANTRMEANSATVKSSNCRMQRITDALPAIGEHHRHVDRDPVRVVTGVPPPQPGQGVAECVGQTGGVSEVSQESGPGVGDHAVGGDGEFRSSPGNLHPESGA
jgi:hypothetical protein